MPDAVYLDWNATTPLRLQARAAWLAIQAQTWSNPASVHRPGQRARQAWDAALLRAAGLLGCRAHELVLTSGGTESIATVVASALPPDGRAVASAIEHSSVLRALAARSANLALVGVDTAGRIDPAALLAACEPAPALVCLQYANNELGTLQDLAQLIPAVRAVAPGAAILVDACQGVGKQPLDLTALGADFVAIAGHKFGAPRGTGLLYQRTGVPLRALLAGGRQQDDRRSGSEDLAGLSAVVAALAAARDEYQSEHHRQAALLDDCLARIRTRLPSATRLAADAPRLAGTLSLAHPGIDAEALVARLDLAGFAVSRASACMARSGEPSHVIAALGLEPELARGAIRVSIGWSTTAAEMDAFAQAYAHEVGAMLG